MATKKNKNSKIIYRERFLNIAHEYKSVVVITVNNISSNHVQTLRKQLRGRAEMIMGKNTFIRHILKELISERPSIKPLIDCVRGNCGLIFTNNPPKEICREVSESKVLSSAKPGVEAPNDVKIPPGPTGMPPDMTAFFQTLNIPTRIVKGQIEIVSEIDLIQKGNRVGGSEVQLLNKLNIKPFLFGPKLSSVFDDGAMFPPDIYLMDDQQILSLFGKASSVIAALGLSLGVPNTASTAHSLCSTMSVLLGLSASSGYSFPEAEQAKAQISENTVSDKSESVKEEKEEKEEEKEESEDEGAGLGDLFGGSGSEEDSDDD